MPLLTPNESVAEEMAVECANASLNAAANLPDPDSIDWLNEWADSLCSRDAELAQRAANEIAYLRLNNRFTHRLAVMLECALLDKTGCWNEAHRTLDEYRAAVHAIDPPLPTFMGEPIGRSDLQPNAELSRAR